jgi:hypothetical protein
MMCERRFRDGEFEEEVNLRHEGVEIIDKRHPDRAQPYDLAEVLAERRMSRALKPSG